MIATADSNVKRRIWIIIKINNKYEDKLFLLLLNKVNKRWPAIILAVNRTAKVPGRIILLIVSIKTIKGIKIVGVPWGIRWINICCVLFNHP